jgi:hypothetical protein
MRTVLLLVSLPLVSPSPMSPSTRLLEQSSLAALTSSSSVLAARTGLGLTTRSLVARLLTSARVFPLELLARFQVE